MLLFTPASPFFHGMVVFDYVLCPVSVINCEEEGPSVYFLSSSSGGYPKLPLCSPVGEAKVTSR